MVGLAVVLLIAGWLLDVPTAFGQSRSIAQYRHTAWSGVEIGGPVWSIDQGPDGLLWLVTPDGLRRYDGQGFRSVPLQASKGASQPRISDILVARSGEIWIGLMGSGGVSVLRGGVLKDQGFPNAQRQIVEIQEGLDGSIWAASARPDNSLARFSNGRWTIYGAAAGLPDGWIFSIKVDTQGAVWVATMTYVAKLAPGTTRFEVLPINVEGGPDLAMDASGRMWLGDAAGVRRLPTGENTSGSPEPRFDTPSARRIRMAFAPDGDLWGALDGEGLFKLHLADGSVTRMTQKDALSGDDMIDIRVDREGTVWTGSQFGLDSFVRTPIVEEERVPRFSSNPRMAQDRGGLVYVLEAGELWIIAPDAAPRRFSGLSGPASAFCETLNGVLLLSDNLLERFVAGRVVERIDVNLPGNLCCCVEDAQKHLWVIQQGGTLSSVVGGEVRDQTDRLNQTPGKALHLDNFGRVYVSDWDGGLLRLADDRRWRPDQLGVGAVSRILNTADGLLVAGEAGLARIGRSRIDRLDAAQHGWLRNLRDLRATASSDIWMFSTTRLTRVTQQDLAQAFQHPQRTLPHLQFDREDGLFSVAARGDQSKMTIAPDGRLWLLGQRGLMTLASNDLGRNRLAPPVTIRGMMVNGAPLAFESGLEVPPGANPIQIDFVAGSLRTPDRVAYRYRLEGVDTDWVHSDSRRFAVYGRLPPGRYRFQVIASNDDGVWNTEGAAVSFIVRPYLWETWWFVALAAGLGAVGLWGLYRLRLHAASGRIRAMMDERLQERERIARDLHDTLLQGVQALILKFQFVADDLPKSSRQWGDLDQALDRADAVLGEARERVLDLRLEGEDLARRLARLVADGQQQNHRTSVTLQMAGDVRSVPKEEADEIMGVAREALANALLHAGASRVTIRFSRGFWRSVLTIDDDGQGVPAAILAAGARAGHFGLQGMRERAKRLGARLSLASGASGTRVTLTSSGLPVSAAFAIARRRFSGSRADV